VSGLYDCQHYSAGTSGLCGECSAALRSSVAHLEEVLKVLRKAENSRDSLKSIILDLATKNPETGELCWCKLDYMIPYRGHDGICRYVKEELGQESKSHE
jgi:hypothetical protein